MSTTPVVYFIDDSATMREVIKIAFRRENIDVVACHDGDSALVQMQQQRPDVVISDLIMPGLDGYAVCERVKQNPATASTPVVLMSGVVNRTVADKAFACRADELIRKPFQPQDLIARVKQLLQNITLAMEPAAAQNGQAAAATLTGIFAAPSANARLVAGGNGFKSQQMPAVPSRIATPPVAAPMSAATPVNAGVAAPAAAVSPHSALVSNGAPKAAASPSGEPAKVKIQLLQLEYLVKKLQSELQAEREYSRALEEHIKTLQDSE